MRHGQAEVGGRDMHSTHPSSNALCTQPPRASPAVEVLLPPGTCTRQDKAPQPRHAQSRHILAQPGRSTGAALTEE